MVHVRWFMSLNDGCAEQYERYKACYMYSTAAAIIYGAAAAVTSPAKNKPLLKWCGVPVAFPAITK
jgi:hypothetical protein